MVEYTKELIDKIVEDFKGRMLAGKGSYCYPIVELGKILESFLPVELPPCPVCGSNVDIEYLNACNRYYVKCFRCDIPLSGYISLIHSKQEAIDAYLAIPYCVMYLERSKDAIH